MIIRVGIELMPNEPASACCASVSTLPNTASGYCSDIRSKTGPNMRHGPHHAAQKSTRARPVPPIVDSKFSAVSSTVAMDPPKVFQAPLRYPPGYVTKDARSAIPTAAPALEPQDRRPAAGRQPGLDPQKTHTACMCPSSGAPRPQASETGGRANPGAGVAGVSCVLGDANLDVVVSLAGPAAEETDTPAVTFTGAGGQAANVAAWITALGGRGRLIAARGTDLASRLVAGELTSRGVDLAGPVIGGRTGVVVSLSNHGRARRSQTAAAAERRPVLHLRRSRIRRQTVPRRARGAKAAGRVRHRGGSRAGRRRARLRDGGQAGTSRRAGRWSGSPRATRARGGLDRGG